MKKNKTQNDSTEVAVYVDQSETASKSELARVDSSLTQQGTTEFPIVDEKLKKKPKFFTTGNMAIMGILTAISYVLYLLPKFVPIFNLPFFPPWLDIQISDLPALLGGFAIGPWASVIIIVLKCALKMPLTSSSCVGELADIIVGIAFVLPASIFYRKFKTRKSAIIGMCIGTVSAIIFSILANWLMLIPFYAWFFGQTDSAKGMAIIVGLVTTLYDKVTVDNFYSYYLPCAVIPFNLMRCIICAVISYFTYKPLSKALHWEIKSKKKAAKKVEESVPETDKKVEEASSENIITDVEYEIADTESVSVDAQQSDDTSTK